jgi:hypothetical protein
MRLIFTVYFLFDLSNFPPFLVPILIFRPYDTSCYGGRHIFQYTPHFMNRSVKEHYCLAMKVNAPGTLFSYSQKLAHVLVDLEQEHEHLSGQGKEGRRRCGVVRSRVVAVTILNTHITAGQLSGQPGSIPIVVLVFLVRQGVLITIWPAVYT